MQIQQAEVKAELAEPKHMHKKLLPPSFISSLLSFLPYLFHQQGEVTAEKPHIHLAPKGQFGSKLK